MRWLVLRTVILTPLVLAIAILVLLGAIGVSGAASAQQDEEIVVADAGALQGNTAASAASAEK